MRFRIRPQAEPHVTFEAWITLGVVTTAVGVMAAERGSPAHTTLAAVTILLVAGVIDVRQAFSGFANPAPISVAALYVVAAAVQKSGMLDRLPALLGSGHAGQRVVLARLLLPTALASSVLNNTPIVAMVAPAVLSWARRVGRQPARFLIPVSFAAILGGILTLIGTSTNLVVSGLLEDAGHRPLGLFEIGMVGLPVALAGTAYLILAAPALLPDRVAPGQDLEGDVREFTVEMIVAPGSPLAGRTVAAGGLRNLEALFLVELERDGHRLAPVSPDEPLAAGDRLVFAGNAGRVLDLQRIPGLMSASERHFPDPEHRLGLGFFEAVVAEDSALVGSTLKAVGFRARYGAAVLAIHRASQRIRTKLGEATLRAGDLLLIVSDEGFQARAERRDFLVVAPIGGMPPARPEKAGVVTIVLAALVLLTGSGTLDIVRAALLAAFALVALRVLTPIEARNAVDLNVLVVIGASFGLGVAVSTSGLADEVANTILTPLGRSGDLGLLLGVLVATMLLTELVTNNAAAVLMFPVAMAAASQAGMSPRAFAIAVALGASASFLSPIGYQTNTMVYAMGGYRFADFARVGLPLTLIVLVVAGLVLPLAWPLR